MDRRHWFARLLNREGGLVRIVPVPENIPPKAIPGFIEFEDEHERFHPVPKGFIRTPERQFKRGKTLRNDDKIVVVEYLEETYGP